MTDLLPVLVAAVGPAFALIGVGVGSRLAGGREHANWLREQRYAVSVELIEFIHPFNYSPKDTRFFKTFVDGFNPLRARADHVDSTEVQNRMKGIVDSAYEKNRKIRKLVRDKLQDELIEWEVEAQREGLINLLDQLQSDLRAEIEADGASRSGIKTVRSARHLLRLRAGDTN